jgi:Na+-driven multidrug efflux pump
MEKQIQSGLKTTFFVHFIAALIFGLIYLLIPEVWANLISWPVKEPHVYRLLGANLLAFAVSSWFAYKETAWEKVKIVVQMEIALTILATLVMLWGLIFAGLPAIGWVNAVIFAAFAIAFAYFYSRK